ncbi:MAG: DNA repair protein RecO [Chromatiales bacterium]|nr:DNA repair protein RecO [Chromatiales bacterium]
MQQRTLLQPAYVLHARPYGDTSLLLEIFSLDHGRQGLVAKGARVRKRHNCPLQPFAPLLLSWSGRGELPTLTDCDRHGEAMGLRGDGLLCGFYINELMYRLTHRHDPHPELFKIYAATLVRLRDEVSQEPLLREFELRLLDSLGYGLILDHDVDSGGPVDADGRYTYIPDLGPRLGEVDGNVAVGVSGRTLHALQRCDWRDVDTLRESKRLLRTVLHYHLGGKPLNSRALFRTAAKPQ